MNFKIGNKIIGIDRPTFIIAEMSANHGGDLNNAVEIIKAASKAGVDAIKLQTYTADTITINSNKKDFLIDESSPWVNQKTLWNLYDKAHTPWEWHPTLFDEARKHDLEIFSTPFDQTAVNFLEKLGCPAYKIASPEITNIPLLKRVGITGKPVIISTGVADYDDIKLAVDTLRKVGNNKIAVLKCTSSYPAPVSEANLLTIPNLIKDFNVVSGISDHTLASVSSIASVSLGGKIIEKHIKLKKSAETLDSFFSLDEDKFKILVQDVRILDKALGKINYKVTPSARSSMASKSSIYVFKDIKKGDVFSKDNIKVVRPGYSIHPKFYESFLGKSSCKDLCVGDRLSLDFIDE